jgi:hypothetical protein
MAPIFGIGSVGQPHHHVRDTGLHFLIAAWAPVGLDGAGAGYAPEDVVLAAPLDVLPRAAGDTAERVRFASSVLAGH